MTATSPTKRKGRLSSSVQETDDAALKARRERNREAQNIFRRRRQAAEAAQAQRVRRLEQVVEEMSSVFMSFVDEMLTTEAIVSGQPSLVGSLRRSMERILELAHEVVGPEEDLVVLPRSNSPPDENRLTGNSQSPDSERSETNSDSGSSLAVTLRRIQPVQQSQTSALTTALSTSTHSAASNSTSATSISPPTPQFTPLHHFQQPSLGKPVTIPSFTLSPQIFGNGWLGTTPTAPGEVMSTGPQHQSPFSFRVASTALQIACQLLVTSPPEYSMTPQEARLFCNTLKGKAREEMVTRLRWLIGPGKHEMHRVIDLPYGRYGHHVYARGELNPTTMEDIEWPWPTRPAGSRIDHFTRFFSIVGVEKQLLALGARMVDSETLELNLNNSPMPNVSDAVPNKQPESWSFVNCFSFPTQPKNGPVTVRLSIPTLVTSLASRSCCLMRGPGIPRAEIGSAIEEAIIKTG